MQFHNTGLEQNSISAINLSLQFYRFVMIPNLHTICINFVL